jgi:hypothetical protein
MHFHEFFFHDGILAITKPFHELFLFSRWNSGYHEAFPRTFSFFHDGILATTGTFKGNTFSGYQHSMNMATLRQFAPLSEKSLACLFPLQCKALPKTHEVFVGSPSFPMLGGIRKTDRIPKHENETRQQARIRLPEWFSAVTMCFM